MNADTEDIAGAKSGARLRHGALNLIETVGQSLAAIAPTLTPALNITVVAGLAGLGCVDQPFRQLSHGNSPVQTPILA